MKMDKIRKRIVQRKMVAKRMHLLTQRQLKVLQLSGEGYTSAEMGLKLNVTDKTVDAHKYHIILKLQLKDRAEYRRVAFKYAVECLLNRA